MSIKCRVRVALVFGGRSAEHEVSAWSARNVLQAIDRTKYELVLIGIDRAGKWYLNDQSRPLLEAVEPAKWAAHIQQGEPVALEPTARGSELVRLSDHESVGQVDVVFPILHGPMGEDGTMQGLLKLAGIPYVGADVLGSAIGMDKDVQKRLLRDAGIRVARFVMLWRGHFDPAAGAEAASGLGYPLFVKPANLGSSVGIAKVHNPAELQSAVDEAFRFDNKVILEETIIGREIECSVLGNEQPMASIPGEILVGGAHEFYTYEAKYLDERGAELAIPARLEPAMIEEIRGLAVRVYETLCIEGFARVDFFLRPNDELVVNEINTIPGFTTISMFPRLWAATGLSYADLIDRLIELALSRHERDQRLLVSR